jgi:hypothetical protein
MPRATATLPGHDSVTHDAQHFSTLVILVLLIPLRSVADDYSAVWSLTGHSVHCATARRVHSDMHSRALTYARGFR